MVKKRKNNEKKRKDTIYILQGNTKNYQDIHELLRFARSKSEETDYQQKPDKPQTPYRNTTH